MIDHLSFRVVVLFAWFLSGACAPVMFGDAWRSITPEELAATTPRLDPEAGAEIIFREVTIDDSAALFTSRSGYVRIKIYNQRGIEALDKIEIGESFESRIEQVAARVVKPDGSEIELDKRAMHTRDVLKQGRKRFRVRSFTFPAMEPGCIVEYRWRETLFGESSGLGGTMLLFQGVFPTWKVAFRVRPYAYFVEGVELRPLAYNYEIPPLKPDRSGFYTFEHKNTPALVEEPWMPPEAHVQSWMYIYFSYSGKTADAIWQKLASRRASDIARAVRPNKSVTQRAQALIADAGDDPHEKLRRLHDFCRTSIRNVAMDTSGLTPEEVAKLKENRNPAQTLERGYGSAEDINCLFIAMATAVGFQARVAQLSDRSDRFFDAKVPAWFMVPDLATAVKVGETWLFANPGAVYLELGRLEWWHESSIALICDAKKYELVPTPELNAAGGRMQRTFRGRLDVDGTLEGDVRIVYTGSVGVSRKREFDAETEVRRTEIVSEALRKRLPAAELSDVTLESASHPIEPMSVAYHVRIPGYADTVGSRLFVRPCFFERDAEAMFPKEQRQHPVYIYRAWTEEDTVEIQFPEGFELEKPAVPQPISLGHVLDYKLRVGFRPKDRMLVYRRELVIPSGFVQASSYPTVKATFDLLHASDNQGLMLRKQEASKVATSPAAGTGS